MRVVPNVYLQADDAVAAATVALFRLELQGWPTDGAVLDGVSEQHQWNPGPGRWWNVRFELPACSLATALGVDS